MTTHCFMISAEILCRIGDKQTLAKKVLCWSNFWERIMKHGCYLTFSSISISLIHVV